MAVAGATAAVVILGASTPASASIALAKHDGAVHVDEERIAMATSAERTVVWEQLSLDVADGDVAWVVAVPKGGWIEGANGDWLDALDGVSAPVIAPARSLGCGVDGKQPVQRTEAPFGTSLRDVDHALLAPTAPLLALDALRAKGWVIDARTAAMLADLDAAGEQVEVLQLTAGSAIPTRTIRILGPRVRSFPSILLPVGTPAPRIEAWILDGARTAPLGVPTIVPKFETLVWEGAQSNYASIFGDALGAAGPGVVVPFASPDATFADPSLGPMGNGPSLVRRYFHAEDSSSTKAWSCVHRAVDASHALAAKTCPTPPPWTSDAPVPTCGTPPDSPSPFVCTTDADDLAVAVAGTTPSHLWITRWEATGAMQSSTATPIEPTHDGALPPFHEVESAKSGACNDGTSTGPGTTNPNPPGNGTPSGSLGSNDPYANSDPYGYGHRSGCDASFGCAASSSSSSSSSSGCDSSSSHSSNDGCSSSSSSGSSDNGCGKSSSGSSSGDGCGKSGGGSSSDNGCGGGSSSGSGGGGCGGGGSGGGGGNGCVVARRRTNVRATPFGYLAIAAAVFARRLFRRNA